MSGIIKKNRSEGWRRKSSLSILATPVVERVAMMVQSMASARGAVFVNGMDVEGKVRTSRTK
jgi:hypothetical protein